MTSMERTLRALYRYVMYYGPQTSEELEKVLAGFCIREGFSMKHIRDYYDYLVHKGNLPRVKQ